MLNSSRGTSEEQVSGNMETFLALACFQSGILLPVIPLQPSSAYCRLDIPAEI